MSEFWLKICIVVVFSMAVVGVINCVVWCARSFLFLRGPKPKKPTIRACLDSVHELHRDVEALAEQLGYEKAYADDTPRWRKKTRKGERRPRRRSYGSLH